MGKKTAFDFFRKFDRYADPIQLTYHELKKFPTPCGGILSLISLSIILLWMGDNIYRVFFYSVSNQTSLFTYNNNNFTFPLHEITQEQMLVANRLTSLNQSAIGDLDIDKYWSVLYTQTKFNEGKYKRSNLWVNETDIYYNSMDCTYDNVTIKLVPELAFGYWCINFTSAGNEEKVIPLQGIFGNHQQQEGIDLSTRILTCEDAANYTGRTDCVSRNESLAVADQILIESITFTQIPPTKGIMPSNYQNYSYDRAFTQTSLDKNLIIFKSVAIQYQPTTFEENWFLASLSSYTDNFYQVLSFFDSYYKYPSDTSNLDAIDRAHYVIKFQMSPNYLQTVQTRVSLLSMLTAFGGLMYTIKNIGNAINRKSADFALDNDMMRRLYSVECDEGENFKKRYSTKLLNNQNSETSQDQTSSSSIWPPTSEQNGETTSQDSKKAGLFSFIKSRMSFYYTWKQYCRRKLGVCYCCLCCLCFSRHKTVEDRIFDKTRKRLLAEIDITNIIKQLRISNALVQMNMKQHQVSLVRWYRAYCVRDKHDIYDVIAKTPGQMFFSNQEQDSNGKAGGLKQKLRQAMRKKLMEDLVKKDEMDEQKKILAGEDLLDFSKQMEMLQDIEQNFNPADDPIDLKMLKSILGNDEAGDSDLGREQMVNFQSDIQNYINNRKMSLAGKFSFGQGSESLANKLIQDQEDTCTNIQDQPDYVPPYYQDDELNTGQGYQFKTSDDN